MKELPILMNAEMVRATLAGTKKQTRRLRGLKEINENPCDWEIVGDSFSTDKYFVIFKNKEGEFRKILCPYGGLGDQLWVRENFRIGNAYDKVSPYLAVCGDGNIPVKFEADKEPERAKLRYWGKLRPSIHMPRCFSRIDLKITEIHVQRIHDITEEDAKAEGLKYHASFREWGGVEVHPAYRNDCPHYRWYESPVEAFKQLFKSINGAEAWDNNPWVWVIKFKRVES